MNRDIVEGLRNALSRGYTLEKAMMSFYNAGYKKEEIEEAARVLHEHPSQPLSHPGKNVSEEVQKPVTKPLSPECHPRPHPIPPIVFKPVEEVKPKERDRQLISKYEEKIAPKGKLTIILLLASLFILIFFLISAFLFKEELVDFFNSLF
jgi:hypothetical protein